jgi:hypothetical protein
MMAKGTDMVHQEGNISIGERIARAAVAISMLFYPMLMAESQMEWIALLPLVAIYPMFTAVVGWDPILFVIETGEQAGRSRQVRMTARIVLASVGALMIAATLTVPTERIGLYSLPALFGIWPVFIAILGENPLLALRESIADVRALHKTKTEQIVQYKLASQMGESAGSDIALNSIAPFHKRAA